jgi:GT2 family glycosyltransferase
VLFSFIKFTQPSWQFNLIPSVKGPFASCYITEQKCSKEYFDNRYETEIAKIADAGYRLWNEGVLLESTREEISHLYGSGKVSLKDEYIFIRKYWGSFWATFALMRRLLELENPFTEIRAYYATRDINKINVHKSNCTFKNFETFESLLISANPLVGVIIPTLNRYDYLKDVLNDLEKQTYRHFEVIVVDQSDEFDRDFYKTFNLQLKVIRQEEKLLWTARNKALDLTDADYLLFFDDDSRIESDWILQHLKCIDYFNADISAGVSLTPNIESRVPSYNYFRWADQFDSGNAMVKRSVIKRIGKFDEQFNRLRMGDGEFGLRAYMNGLKSISNPKAFRYHLKGNKGGLREMGSWDGFRSKKWFAPKPIPSVIYLYKKYYPPYLYKNALIIGILLSNIPYKYKRNSTMLLVSIILTMLKAPVLIIQFYRSARIAKKMLI